MHLSDFLQQSDLGFTTILSIVVGIAALGGALYKLLSWYSQQNEKRARVIKTALEDQARVVKDVSEEKAKELLLTTQNNARQIEKALDDRARDVKKDLETTTLLLKEKISNIEQVIAAMTTDIKHNFELLAKRADLTNGNVAAIRNDMADLAADIQELFEKVDPASDSQQAVKVSRDKNVRRRERKREIESDRISQLHEGEKPYSDHQR